MKKKFEKGLSENAKKNPNAIWSYIKSHSKTEEVFLLLPFMLVVFVGMNLCSRSFEVVKKIVQFASMLRLFTYTNYG
jgi:hypothetical protein